MTYGRPHWRLQKRTDAERLQPAIDKLDEPRTGASRLTTPNRNDGSAAGVQSGEPSKKATMKIDDKVEPLVRDALHGAIKHDIDRLDTSLKAFRDEASRRKATQLLVAVCGYVLVDLYGGQKPNDEQIQALAEQVTRSEGGWSGLDDPSEIAAFIRLALGDGSQHVEPDAGVLMIFVVTARLLAGRPMPEGKWWFNYLDQVEAALENPVNPAS